MSLRRTNKQFIDELTLINPNIKPLDPYVTSKQKITCECLKDGYEWKVTPGDLLSGYGCPVCGNRACWTGYNDVATKRPDLIKYFVDKSEASVVTQGSHKRVLLKCPDCGTTKMQTVKDLCNRGFSCLVCGDGVSYPNKFIRNLLKQLNIDFTCEYSPDWANGKFYDVYFTNKGSQYIVQMDGSFHYERIAMSKDAKPYDFATIDKLKDKWAEEHGIIMIRIDSRESTAKYLKRNIEDSLLGRIFDLSKVDWIQCDKDATSNLAKLVCEYYEENYNKMNQYEIAEKFNVSRSAIWTYINRGIRFGWCQKHKRFENHKPHKLTDDFAKQVCEYYEKHYKTDTKVEVSHRFNINYTSFEICFKKGLEKGWCREHPVLIRNSGMSEERKIEICQYYDKYYARYPKKDMAKHFNISHSLFTRTIKEGIKCGWCQDHPRIAKNKKNRK